MRHTPDPKTQYFLCVYRSRIGDYDRGAGYIIQQELDGPEIPADMTDTGHFVILKIVRKFRIDAIVNYKTEELPT